MYNKLYITRKITTATLLAAVLIFTIPAGTASAGAGLDEIVIGKGDEGDNVILLQMRLRDLGFYGYKVTGYFGDFTAEALKDFQKESKLTADGVAGKVTLDALYGNEAHRKPVEPLVTPANPSNAKKAKVKTGAYTSWSTVNSLWKIGMRCKVIDFNTGISYYMKRCNQSYSVGHADVAPATKADLTKFKKTYNNHLNAYRRALVVIIGGQRYAASMYAEPHGSTGVKGNGMNIRVGNNPDGKLQQVCIHFRGSRNNVHDMIDPSHQYQVKRAAGMKNSGDAPGLVYPGD